MGLTNALNAARSGLTMASRWAATTSMNISNSGTEGYARRSPVVAVAGRGEPVVTGISRAVDASLDRMYRLESARTETQVALADDMVVYTAVLGEPESGDSLLSRFTDFRNALGLLSVSPSDIALQRAAVTEAEELSGTVNRTHDALTRATTTATEAVKQDVAEANRLVARIALLNERLASAPEQTDMTLSMEDQRTRALDDLAQLMDFTVTLGKRGEVEIFASGGAPVLDGDTPEVLRHDTATGRLFAGDHEITPGITGVRGISEGSIAGHIAFLNDSVPLFQKQLDEVARSLIDAFQTTDPTLGATDAGLFTDAGVRMTGPYAEGLAGRLSVNDAVRPEAGGALWRIRDGMEAATAGAAGDSTLINGFTKVLDDATGFDGTAGLGATATLSGYMSTLIASQQGARAQAETDRDTASAGAEAVQSRRQAFMGVNIDDEMQQMLQIEQTYAANARVMQTANEMLDTLLRAF